MTTAEAPRKRGALQQAWERMRHVSFGLIVGIAICTLILVLADTSPLVRATLQTITAILGAALGNALRVDYERNVVHNQARPAVRHLFDHVGRLQILVINAENRQSQLRKTEAAAEDRERVADWFGAIGQELRHEIDATATAIENWGDLAPEVRSAEFDSYLSRSDRMPPTPRHDSQKESNA